MSRYANKTSTIRWQDETNYSQAWIDRGKCLMQLFLKQEFNGNLNYKISEFGCGPYAPISKFCKDAPSFKVYKSDIKKWDLETKIVDLNSCPDIDVTDISVLSGVLEYLNDLEIILQKIMSKSKYLLLSYAYVPKTAMSDDLSYITEIKRRAMGNGWRNHLTNEDLLKLLSRVGVVSGLDSWNGNQTLYLVRNFKVVA